MAAPRKSHLPCPDCGVERNEETTTRSGLYNDGSPRFKGRCRKCFQARRKLVQPPDYVKNYKAKRRREAGITPRAERPPRTHCRLGHLLDGLHKGKPYCRTCNRNQARVRDRARGVKPRHKTHCPQGHELTDDNIRGGRHNRSCKLCHRIRERKGYDREARDYIAIIVNDPCSYCGRRGGTIDHIHPVAKGGTDLWTNLTGACKSCNCRKRTIDLLQFMLRTLGTMDRSHSEA